MPEPKRKKKKDPNAKKQAIQLHGHSLSLINSSEAPESLDKPLLPVLTQLGSKAKYSAMPIIIRRVNKRHLKTNLSTVSF